MAKELIDSYLGTAQGFMAEIMSLYSRQEWEACGSLAHKFVSTNGSVGAMRFAQLLRRVEGACQDQNLSELEFLLTQSQYELHSALNELQALSLD